MTQNSCRGGDCSTMNMQMFGPSDESNDPAFGSNRSYWFKRSSTDQYGDSDSCNDGWIRIKLSEIKRFDDCDDRNV